MKIVQFRDGTYGIKRGWWIFSKFLDTNDNFWWNEDYVDKYCKMLSIEKARSRLKTMSRPYYKVIE